MLTKAAHSLGVQKLKPYQRAVVEAIVAGKEPHPNEAGILPRCSVMVGVGLCRACLSRVFFIGMGR